jgi:predicted signal transduction protein with EAL and GGDEF domain
MFVELSNLNTYSQFYDIEISDEILKHVFKGLKKHIARKDMFLYRTDQIVIIQEFKNTHVINNNLRYDEQYRNASKLLHFLKRQKYSLSNGNEYEIKVNIGVASQGVRKLETSINDVVRLAHFSMIKSKESKSDIVVAKDDLRYIKLDLDNFNQEIEKGFKLDEFSPFFLPIIDVKSLKIIGCEALVRWRKNRYRVIEASRFKEIAMEKHLF